MRIKLTWQKIALAFSFAGQAAQFYWPEVKWLGTPFAALAVIAILGGDSLDAWTMVVQPRIHESLYQKWAVRLVAIVCVIVVWYLGSRGDLNHTGWFLYLLSWTVLGLTLWAVSPTVSLSATQDTTAAAAAMIVRDCWFYDAVFYRVNGRWPKSGESLFEENPPSEGTKSWEQRIRKTPTFAAVVRVLPELRQAARDGDLLVWGIPDPSKILHGQESVDDRTQEPIRADHWSTHRVYPVWMLFKPWSVHTLRGESEPGDSGCFGALKVSRAQIEKLYPQVRSEESNNSEDDGLRISFSEQIGGCIVKTRFANTEQATFYRLWIRPPAGKRRTNCRGTVVDVMEETAGHPGHWHSVWAPERLSLAWAVHLEPPVTSLDLLDDHGRFLDVIFVTEFNRIGFGTPGLKLPISLDGFSFHIGRPYLICVSVVSDQDKAEDICLRVEAKEDWENITVTRHRSKGIHEPRQIPLS